MTHPTLVDLKACREALDAELEYKYKLIAENEDLKNEITRLEKLVYVPGLWRCAKCECQTVCTNLHVNTGGFSANNTPQQCPNNCGPMWRVTERDASNEVCDKLEKLSTRPTPALEELRGEIVEELAKLEHDQWMQWAKTIITSEAITAERKARWISCFRPYHELTDEQKEHDRVWARKAYHIINQAFAKHMEK